MSETTEMRLILAMAPSFQGGHSKIGCEVADYLGVPFPLTTTNLEKKAKACGFDPYDIWPWLKQIRTKQSPATDTQPEESSRDQIGLSATYWKD